RGQPEAPAAVPADPPISSRDRAGRLPRRPPATPAAPDTSRRRTVLRMPGLAREGSVPTTSSGDVFVRVTKGQSFEAPRNVDGSRSIGDFENPPRSRGS